MTNPTPPEISALILLGELKGSVDGLRESNTLTMAQIASMQATNALALERLETKNQAAVAAINARVGVLESWRIKVAGFAIGAAMLMTLTMDKLPALFHFLM